MVGTLDQLHDRLFELPGLSRGGRSLNATYPALPPAQPACADLALV